VRARLVLDAQADVREVEDDAVERQLVVAQPAPLLQRLQRGRLGFLAPRAL